MFLLRSAFALHDILFKFGDSKCFSDLFVLFFFLLAFIDHELVAYVLFGVEIVHSFECFEQNLNELFFLIAVKMLNGLLVDLILQL